MTTVHRWRVVLGFPKKSIPRLLERAKAIFNGISGNPMLFVTPNPPLATLQSRIQALDQAQQTAGTHAKGTAAARDVKAGELVTSVETTRAYVQELVDASPEQGAAIIQAAAMMVGQASLRNKPVLQAKQGAPAGVVRVVANIGVVTADTSGKVFFNWQSSSDGGTTWSPASSTPYGRTELAGLTPMVTYAFRVSVTDANGPHEWSQAVTLLVR